MTRCNAGGCEWRPEQGDEAAPEREQLRAHALDAGHGLCLVCSRSLRDTEPQTCDQCIDRAQALLSGIITMWTELPRELGHAKAAPLDHDGRGGGDERPLPGGMVLALLAPGSSGQAPRRLTSTDLERGVEGKEHLEDNRADRSVSVAWQLDSWAQDWASTRGEELDTSRRSVNATVRAAAGYLERHTRWAGNTHGAFDEYLDDLADLHARLEVALGRVRRPVKAGADCFDCGGPLVRPVGASGLEDEHHVVCRHCGAVYDGQRYTLALAARRQEGLDGWLPVPAAALASKRPVRTLRAWLGTHVPWALHIEPREPTPDDPSPWRVVKHLAWYPALAEKAEKARRKIGA